MFYIRLHAKDPYLEFVNAEERKTLSDIAKEFIQRDENDPTLYLETVSPQGFHGLYGFLMDEEALRYQTSVNPIATP